MKPKTKEEERANYYKYRDRILKWHREKYQKNKEFREQQNKYGGEYYKKNRELILEKAKAKSKDPAFLEKRKRYVEQNKKNIYETHKRWRIKNKDKVHNWVKKHIAKNKKKHRARGIAGHIKIPSGIKCVYCDKLAEQRHHPDYSKPKEVIFVCKECHYIL